MLLQPYVRAFLVRAGQPAVTGNIGSQHGHELPREVFASQGWSSLPTRGACPPSRRTVHNIGAAPAAPILLRSSPDATGY